jgi:hypothetical protein
LLAWLPSFALGLVATTQDFIDHRAKPPITRIGKALSQLQKVVKTTRLWSKGNVVATHYGKVACRGILPQVVVFK